MKIVAVILLILGIGLTVLGAGYLFSSDGEVCQKYDAAAKEKLAEAQAAQGTPKEKALMEEARMEVDSAEAGLQERKEYKADGAVDGTWWTRRNCGCGCVAGVFS